MQSIQGQIKEIQDLTTQTSNWTAVIEDNSKQADKNVENIEKMIEEITNTINSAMDYIKTDGAAALTKAVTKSDKLGQQSDQMTEIAKSAREFVEKYFVFISFY